MEPSKSPLVITTTIKRPQKKDLALKIYSSLCQRKIKQGIDESTCMSLTSSCVAQEILPQNGGVLGCGDRVYAAWYSVFGCRILLWQVEIKRKMA